MLLYYSSTILPYYCLCGWACSLHQKLSFPFPSRTPHCCFFFGFFSNLQSSHNILNMYPVNTWALTLHCNSSVNTSLMKLCRVSKPQAQLGGNILLWLCIIRAPPWIKCVREIWQGWGGGKKCSESEAASCQAYCLSRGMTWGFLWWIKKSFI